MDITNTYSIGESDIRPWGAWQVVDAGAGHVVKRITVNPGQRLSLQYHRHRAERWTAVAGSGTAEIDGTHHPLAPGTSVGIPLGAVHRLSSTGPTPLVIIEIQYGDRLDEDDIVRIEDDYARAPSQPLCRLL